MADHPSEDELSGFVLGTLPPGSTDSVAEHIEHCTPCQQTICELDAHKDTLLLGLRRASPAIDEACQKAVDKAAAIGKRDTSKSSSDQASAMSISSTPASTAPSKEQFIAALQTSRVLDAEQWAALQTVPAVAAAGDAQALARALVEAKALTKYQATLIYQNKPRSLMFGEYVVIDKIGAGGMGQVFKARHRRMKRMVAIKVLAKSAVNSPEAVKRFQREVEAAAKLLHPNIVTAFDAGQQENVHFLVMEYVEGSDLANLVKTKGPLQVDQAIDYILQAARGLEFAHKKGVVHRDIKPANLLLDAEGTVKILDMGLARLDDALGANAAHDGLTQSGQVMGTVDYMAPEQALDTRTADAKADIYALGCTLHRMLVGENLYGGETLVQKLLAHREQPIPALGSKRTDVPDDLDEVFRKMVAKRPEDRYQSMREVIDALEQVRRDLAAPGKRKKPAKSAAAKAKATVERAKSAARGAGRRPPQKWVIAAAAAGFLFVALGVIFIIRNPQGKEIARIPGPNGSSVTVVNEPDAPNPPSAPQSPSAPNQPSAPAKAPLIRPAFSGPSPFDAFQRANIPPYELKVAGVGDPAKAPKELVGVIGDSHFRGFDKSYSMAFSPDGQSIATGHDLGALTVWDRQTGEIKWTYPSNASDVVFSPDGKQVAASDHYSNVVLLFDAATGEKLKELRLSKSATNAGVNQVAFLSDSKHFIAIGKGDFGSAYLWDIAHGSEVRRFDHAKAFIITMALSPDDKWLITCPRDQAPRIWDVATGKEVRQLEGVDGDVAKIEFLADGKRVAVSQFRNPTGVWDFTTGKRLYSVEGSGFALSRDGTRLATLLTNGPSDMELVWWDAATGARLHKSGPILPWASDFAFSPDGAQLALAGSNDRSLRLFDCATGKQVNGLPFHGSKIEQLDVTDDGTKLAWVWGVVNRNATTVWDVVQGKAILQTEPEGSGRISLSRNGRLLALGKQTATGTPQLWDVATAKPLAAASSGKNQCPSVFNADGRQVAMTTFKASGVWDVATGKQVVQFESLEYIGEGIDWCHATNQIVTTKDSKGIKIWDAATGKAAPVQIADGSKGARSAWFSPDGSRLAVQQGAYFSVAVYDVTTGKQVFKRSSSSKDQTARFSPDSKLVAIGGSEGLLTLHDAKTGDRQHEWQFWGAISSVTFTPDGRHLLAGMGNGTIYVLRLADAPRPTTATRSSPLDALKREDIPAEELKAAGFGDPAQAPAELVTVLGDSRMMHWKEVSAMAYSPDGRTLVSAGRDGLVRFWDLETGWPRHEIDPGMPVQKLALSPDGKTLAYALDGKNEIQLWNVETNRAIAQLKGHTRGIGALAFDPSGRWLASGGTDNTIKIWSTANQQLAATLTGHTHFVDNVTFSHDGKLLASGSRDKKVMLWDLNSEAGTAKLRTTLDGFNNGVTSLRFSPDSRVVAAADSSVGGKYTGTFLWDVASGAQLQKLPTLRNKIAFSADGKRLFGHGDKGFCYVNVGSTESHRLADISVTWDINELVRSPDGRSSAMALDRGAIGILDLDTLKMRDIGSAREGSVQALAVGTDGRTIAWANGYGPLRLWDATTGNQRTFTAESAIGGLALSQDCQWLVSNGAHATGSKAYLWNVSSGLSREVPAPLNGHTFAFHPAGKLFGGVGNGPWLFDRESGKPIAPAWLEYQNCRMIAFTPDGRSLVAVGFDKERTIRVWDLASGNLTASMADPKGMHSLAISPDSRFAATGLGSGTDITPDVKIWDLTTGQQVSGFQGVKTRGELEPESLAFSPDGRLLAVVSHRSSDVRLCDVKTGAVVRSIQLYRGNRPNGARCVAFDSTGRYLITGNGNGTVYVLRLEAAPEPAVASTAASSTTSSKKITTHLQPEFQQWVKVVQAQPAQQQIEAVSKKLMELNPGFDGNVTGYGPETNPKIESGAVIEFGFAADNVADLSPIAALSKLTGLRCAAAERGQSKLADLSPLNGLALKKLNCQETKVVDLSPLAGMPLTDLNAMGCSQLSDLSPLAGTPLVNLRLERTKVSDLSPLAGKQIYTLMVNYTPVADLSPLRGMPLTSLQTHHNKVTNLWPLAGMPLEKLTCHDNQIADLSPLRGLPLKDLNCDFIAARDTAILRSMTRLEIISGKPAADFWKEAASGAPAARANTAEPVKK